MRPPAASPLPLGVALLLAAGAAPARSRADDLSVDVPTTAAVTGAAAAAFAALELTGGRLTPSSCRWCEPPGIDRTARLHLRWERTQLAAHISDVMLGAVPLSLLGAHYFVANDPRKLGQDALVVAESMTLTLVATDAVKFSTARRRPAAWAAGVRKGHDDDNAFVSGHTSATFAGATAFGTVAMLRGYPGWPYLYGAGVSGAAAVSYFRIAADRHWLTDVLGGAALGTAVGVAVPVLLHRRGDDGGERPATWIVTPMPLGVAGTF